MISPLQTYMPYGLKKSGQDSKIYPSLPTPKSKILRRVCLRPCLFITWRNLRFRQVCWLIPFVTWRNFQFRQVCWLVPFVCVSVREICSPSTGHNFGVIASKFFSQIGIQPIRKPLDFGDNRIMGSGPKKSRKIPKIPISHHCGNFKNSYLRQK